jgi:hypothetical protein
MNTGIERRPFKVLRPLKHSTAMVIARYTNRAASVIPSSPIENNGLLWKALRVASLFAACAFAFLVLRERHLFERSGYTLGALPDSIERVPFGGKPAVALPPAAPVEDGKTLSQIELPEASNLTVTKFNLPVAPEFQEVGDVELRLAGVNAAAHTYDITVRTRAREFYRQDVKVDEHVPLLRNSPHGPELVVAAVEPNRVIGYVSEPLHRGRHRHRRRT